MKKLIASFLALVSAAAFGTTTVPVQLLNPTGSSSGQTIVSTGASSAPGWSTLGLSGLSAISSNTLVGNATGSSATPTAIPVAGCNGAAQALQYTSAGGSSAFGCNSNLATSGANSNITSLTGLTTPLGTSAGGLGANNGSANGVPVFSSGAATVTAATGTGSPVLATSPSITTPVISGVTSGACAAAGKIGECVNSNVPQGSAISLTNNTAANVTSVPLTAGNWLCYGNVAFLPAGTTVTSQELGWISTTSAAVPTPTNSGSEVGLTNLSSTAGGNANILPVGMLMVNITTTTTVYLSAYASFTTSTNVAYGYINCIRWH
jgi:hypothetical protein